eukprot:gene26673-biopygen17122
MGYGCIPYHSIASANYSSVTSSAPIVAPNL